MNHIQELLNQINVTDLIKVFNIQISIAVLLISIIFRHIFSQIVLKILFKFTKSDIKPKDSIAYNILSRFCIFLGLYFSIRLLRPTAQTLAIINTLFKIICIIYIAKLINSNINKNSKWINKYTTQANRDAMIKFVCKITRGIVWIIAFYIIVRELGYDLTGLVAGLGLGGVIISLAAQDTVKSLLSGIVILTDKPFDIGDFIEIGNHKGTVMDMTFRSTRIKAVDNSIVTIPNSTVTSEYIINWNKLKTRRFECVLNLDMNTNTEKIKDLITKLKLVLKNNPKILPDTVQVNLETISSYSTDIKMYFYINESSYVKFLDAKEEIYCDILDLVEKENIDLAYPTQTVYLKNTETEKLNIDARKMEELIGEEDSVFAKRMLEEKSDNKNEE